MSLYMRIDGRCNIRTVLKFGKGLLKALFIGIVAVGAIIMNCIGAMICAITE